MEITITQALTELKTLKDRIRKSRVGGVFIVCKTKNKNYQIREDTFLKNATADFQSYNALVTRWHKLKSSVAMKNAVTFVEISGKKMSVIEAIEYKKVIDFKKELVEEMKKQKLNADSESDAHHEKVQAKIDSNIQLICGKESKTDTSAIQAITESITKTDPVEIFDPLGLEKKIKDMEEEIETFTTNVDYILSISNTKTFIEV